MILASLQVAPDAFERGTGWAIKPEGACRGDVCVPLPDGVSRGGQLDVAAAAERLGMPVVHDEAAGLWAVGPSTVTGRALSTAEAPELTLPDLSGAPFALSTLRGQKVLLAAWASW